MGKLLLIGDSVLKGIVFNEGRCRILENDNRFSPLEKGGTETVNLSKMGATAHKIKRTVDALEELEGDTDVLFSFGGNDSNYDWASISRDPEGEHLPKVPRGEFSRIYRDCIGLMKKKGARRVFVTNLIPLEQHKFFTSISKGNDGANILRWLGDENMLYRWHESYSRMTERIAAETGSILVDLRSPLLLLHEYSSLICEDGIHPTDKGHEILGEMICKAVIEA